jgi:putative transposase
MKKDFTFTTKSPSTHFDRALQEALRAGARRLLQQAIENEVQEFIDAFSDVKTEDGGRSVIRNGYLPERPVQTGIGPISLRQPRARDKEKKHSFRSAILPPYVRRTPNAEAAVSAMYLKGISTNSLPEALEAILGEGAKGLSPTNIVRLKESWEAEYQEWSKRDLSGNHYVYVWADGIYFNVRLGEDRPCLLVLIGALKDGAKEIIGIYDGHRESKLSWEGFLNDLKGRGMTLAPSLAIGDGALGFWAALEEVFPETRAQRC